MAWPGINDYHIAVQNPRNCFVDVELKEGRILLDRRGLPRVASGNFAVVYHIHNGGRNYAVKCFTREVTDHHRRYDLIARHLKRE